MPKKIVTRKIISSSPKEALDVVEEKAYVSKKRCLFCQQQSLPSYTDSETLKRFLTDRAKILGKERSGVCSKHQRAIAKNIKYARHLALLPFVPKV